MRVYDLNGSRNISTISSLSIWPISFFGRASVFYVNYYICVIKKNNNKNFKRIKKFSRSIRKIGYLMVGIFRDTCCRVLTNIPLAS